LIAYFTINITAENRTKFDKDQIVSRCRRLCCNVYQPT
jgi:hypothetical protein